jgi:hypothetical protein
VEHSRSDAEANGLSDANADGGSSNGDDVDEEDRTAATIPRGASIPRHAPLWHATAAAILRGTSVPRSALPSYERRRVKTHVVSIHFKCFRCFRGMLQVFQINVAKVDQDVAYIAMAVHVCCKRLFLMFHLCFHTYVASMFI